MWCFFFSLKVEYMFSLAVKAQSRQHDKWVSAVKVKLILPSLTWAIEGGSFIVPWKVIRQSNCILYCPGTSAWRLLEQFIYHGQYSILCLSCSNPSPLTRPARKVLMGTVPGLGLTLISPLVQHSSWHNYNLRAAVIQVESLSLPVRNYTAQIPKEIALSHRTRAHRTWRE